MNNLEGMFDAVNQQVSDVASQVGNTPQNFSPGVFSMILSVVIFVIVYGRMMKIYLMTSLAPIPFSTFGNREPCPQRDVRALRKELPVSP